MKENKLSLKWMGMFIAIMLCFIVALVGCNSSKSSKSVESKLEEYTKEFIENKVYPGSGNYLNYIGCRIVKTTQTKEKDFSTDEGYKINKYENRYEVFADAYCVEEWKYRSYWLILEYKDNEIKLVDYIIII